MPRSIGNKGVPISCKSVLLPTGRGYRSILSPSPLLRGSKGEQFQTRGIRKTSAWSFSSVPSAVLSYYYHYFRISALHIVYRIGIGCLLTIGPGPINIGTLSVWPDSIIVMIGMFFWTFTGRCLKRVFGDPTRPRHISDCLLNIVTFAFIGSESVAKRSDGTRRTCMV